jgi:hypothetical protein
VLTDLCWQVIDVIEAAEIERAKNEHKHAKYQIALTTAMDCYEAVTGSFPEKRRGRSDRHKHAVKILVATMMDSNEALVRISEEIQNAKSEEERRVRRDRNLTAAKIAGAKMLACCKALTRISAGRERANSGNESGLSKRRRTRSD